jgi:hypothetical protein
MKNHIYIKATFILIFCLISLSCKKLIEIDPPKDSLVESTILENNDLGTAAIAGIYRSMSASGFASGNSSSITSVGGLTADELNSHATTLTVFYENQISSETGALRDIYFLPYQNIYAANSILERLDVPNGVTPPVRMQLRGEALFIRAFNYFYLVNMFGAVPLQLSSDYRITGIASRTAVASIYQQIISDLKTAESMLKDSYVTTERVRPNLSAVQALLARTYLYIQDWANAEKYASLVIGKTEIYSLVNLDAVFLKNSKEAIWQLMPAATTGNSNDGVLFILTGTPANVSLNSNFAINGFEVNDNRKTSWIKSLTNSTGTYYYPFKYKTRATTPVTEYSMVLRLAEQFLIRAEARTQQNNLDGAIADLDAIRNRAGVALIKITNPTINKADLLTAIQKERRVEFFSEWGHRWFDLKRTETANTVLSLIKPKWQISDMLYPIPEFEITNNHNITQNPGY